MRKIRAIFFDLDDTLYNCSGQLAVEGQRLAAKVLVGEGLAPGEDEAILLQEELEDPFSTRSAVFAKIARRVGKEGELVEKLLAAYNSGDLSNITPFEDAIPVLGKLKKKGLKLFLVTDGSPERQRQKVRVLGFEEFFDEVAVTDPTRDNAKEEVYLRLMRAHQIFPQEAMAVGDRLSRDIRPANRVGMTTAQMTRGHYRAQPPASDLDRPTYKIGRLVEIEKVLFAAEHYMVLPDLKVVALGGGTGLPIVLNGLKPFTRELTGVVTVTDSGRSTGMIRKDYDIPAPGDLRNCLIALSEGSDLLRKLFQFRFDRGSFDGMSFGNLLLTALTQITGSFEIAVKVASSLLKVDGAILPSTLDNVHLFAELDDGSILEQEHNVRALKKTGRIRRLFLRPEDATPLEASLEAIAEADLIVLGPGSLLTSVIPNLLIKGVREALSDSRAEVVYVLNVMTQPGQTDGFDAVAHVRFLLKHLNEGSLDAIVVNSERPEERLLKKYRDDGAEFVEPNDALRAIGIPIVEGEMLEAIRDKRAVWNKQDLLRHDPEKLGNTLYGAIRWRGLM